MVRDAPFQLFLCMFIEDTNVHILEREDLMRPSMSQPSLKTEVVAEDTRVQPPT